MRVPTPGWSCKHQETLGIGCPYEPLGRLSDPRPASCGLTRSERGKRGASNSTCCALHGSVVDSALALVSLALRAAGARLRRTPFASGVGALICCTLQHVHHSSGHATACYGRWCLRHTTAARHRASIGSNKRTAANTSMTDAHTSMRRVCRGLLWSVHILPILEDARGYARPL